MERTAESDCRTILESRRGNGESETDGRIGSRILEKFKLWREGDGETSGQNPLIRPTVFSRVCLLKKCEMHIKELNFKITSERGMI